MFSLCATNMLSGSLAFSVIAEWHFRLAQPDGIFACSDAIESLKVALINALWMISRSLPVAVCNCLPGWESIFQWLWRRCSAVETPCCRCDFRKTKLKETERSFWFCCQDGLLSDFLGKGEGLPVRGKQECRRSMERTSSKCKQNQVLTRLKRHKHAVGKNWRGCV